MKPLMQCLEKGTGMPITNKEIDSFIRTGSHRPQVWYNMVRQLVREGFVFNHLSGKWIHPDGEKGSICTQGNRAWLHHPHQDGQNIVMTREIEL